MLCLKGINNQSWKSGVNPGQCRYGDPTSSGIGKSDTANLKSPEQEHHVLSVVLYLLRRKAGFFMESDNGGEQIKSIEHRGIIDAKELFEREVIEAEAWLLIESREQRPRVETLPQEHHSNARTAIMEALTASGHLSPVELFGTLEEINTLMLDRLLGGWNESLPQHEQKRRFAEICNELIIQKTHRFIAEGQLPDDTEVLEISDYATALEASVATRLGYRAQNKKGMVRSTSLLRLPDGRHKRLIETVSRSQSAGQSTFGFLKASNIQTGSGPADLVALQTPIIYTRKDYADGVVDIMRRLDRHAGNNVLYGDSIERKLRHPMYEDLREESARREAEVMPFVDKLALLEDQLADMVNTGMLDQEGSDVIFKDEVLRILNAICTLEPHYAEDTFGERAAPIFFQAAYLASQGYQFEAQTLLEENQYLMDEVTFCGVSISAKDAQKKGLQVNSYGELVTMGKEKWEWKQGVCVVKTCKTRPGKTEVGPCSVCRMCQAKFDGEKLPESAERVVLPVFGRKKSRRNTDHLVAA